MSGWIKLHRRLLDWEWYDDQNVFRVFMHLLLTANFEPSKYKGYDIPAGCKVAGVHALAEQTGLTSQKVRTALDKLKSTKEITIKTTNKFSIISVRCWNDYQRDNKQITNHQQTSNKQVTTSKEGKELKKEIKGSRMPKDWHLEDQNIEHALSKGFKNGQIQELGESFKDYWLADSTPKGVKKDWDAAFRTWVRNAIKFQGGNNDDIGERIR